MLIPKPVESYGLEDEVTSDQLPYQIREYYIGPPLPVERFWLKGTKAVLQFFPRPPYQPWTDYWEKTTSGDWSLVQTDRTSQP